MSEPRPHARDRLPIWRRWWRAAGRLAVGVDFDGTLAPIVPDPEAAQPLPGALSALARLADRRDARVAVLSGLALDDLQRRLPVAGVWMAGNHGFEIVGPDGTRWCHPDLERSRAALGQAAEQLRRAAAAWSGVFVEDKGGTLSVHVRHADPTARAAVEAAVRAVAEREGWRLTRGLEVWELRPAVAWHKGKALEWLLARWNWPAATPLLYWGDDTTDEDAFAWLRQRNAPGEGVLVGPPEAPSAATAWVEGPDGVAALLAALADGP